MNRERVRKSGLSTRDLCALDLAVGSLAWLYHGACTHLVGTAQTGGDYRDVDVRTILRDEDFDALIGNDAHLWSVLSFLIGDWLSRQTGLPVDYQIQRMTEANERFDGPRNPLGQRRGYAGYGDATPFDAYGERAALDPETPERVAADSGQPASGPMQGGARTVGAVGNHPSAPPAPGTGVRRCTPDRMCRVCGKPGPGFEHRLGGVTE